ncbi:MAG TPA: hypothetical protein VN437_05135, partial [Rectinemataceae bacterium]|nr:hypothetical protein [Rectinemataceae bacterium]
ASTWAMVAHEALATVDPRLGFFSKENPYASLGLGDRIALYSRAGLAMCRGGRKTPEETAEALRKGKYES